MRHSLVFLLSATVASAAGAQSFSTGLHASCTSPDSVRVADLDGDGDRDVLTTHPGIDRVCANRNLSAGLTWANGTLFVYPAGSAPTESVLANFDGSGRVDAAVVLNGTAQVAIHRALGAWPGFAVPQIVPVGSGPVEATPLDYDNDGDVDLAVLCNIPNAIHILANDGSGVFSTAGVVPLSIAGHAIEAGDLNADGRPDLVVTGSSGTAFADVLINTTTGIVPTFAPEQLFGVDFRPFGVCIGDLNGDGYADIATANAAFSTVDVLLNQPGAISGTTVAFVGTNYPLAPGVIAGPNTEIDCGDIDCDGDADLGVTCNATNEVAFFVNDGTGAFTGPSLFPDPTGCGDIAFADVSGDGQLDVATANTNSSTIGILLNAIVAGCCEHRMIGGIPDGFDTTSPTGPEDACPAPDLLAWYGSGPRRDFDGPRQCRTPLLHTFRGIPGRVKRARLTMRMRADCRTAIDDAIQLGFDGPNGRMVWTGTMSALTGSPWTAGTFGGVSLDLGALPGGASLLAKISSEGRLDVVVRDDTAVDAMILEVETCARSRNDMSHGATPYVTGTTWTWSASGAPNSPPGGIAFLLGAGLGAGPTLPGGMLCITSPSILGIATTSASGTGSYSLPFPAIPFPPCVTLSTQAFAWDGTFSTFATSNTLTQQIFD